MREHQEGLKFGVEQPDSTGKLLMLLKVQLMSIVQFIGLFFVGNKLYKNNSS